MPTIPTAQNFRAGLAAIAFAVLASCWLAYYPLPLPEFYKEWTFGMSLVVAALVAFPLQRSALTLRHPLMLAAAGLGTVLLLQAVTGDGLWPKAMQMLGYLGFFVFAMMLGRTLVRQKGAQAQRVVLASVLAAALGSCIFAGLQMHGIELDVPLVAARSGRLGSNLAQANHFADLLWLGIVATVSLAALGAIGRVPAALAVVALLAFAHLTGSRSVWLYLVLAVGLGLWLRWRAADAQVRRIGAGLLAAALAFVPVAALVKASGVETLYAVQSTAARAGADASDNSSAKRLWLLHVAADAARSHPLLGVGAGRYVGHGIDVSMRAPADRLVTTDANAHNLVLHVAAELGLPAALLLAGAIAVWLFRGLRAGLRDAAVLAPVLLGGVIIVHAMLEYPLWYLYFLGLFGLFAGMAVPALPASEPARLAAEATTRWPAVAMLVLLVASYAHFQGLESAMQVVTMQVGMGGAPQPDKAMNASLDTVPRWSPYRDYAEAIRLITAAPTAADAADLAGRCDRAIRWAPSPYLLARCATIHQVAGNAERATQFANTLCRLYPRADRILIESLLFVETRSPSVESLQSRCVERSADAPAGRVVR